MLHIGLLCPEVAGHLNPMTTLCRELQRRGYRVTLVGSPDGAARAEAAGLGFHTVGQTEFPLGMLDETTAELGKLTGWAAVRYTLDLYLRGAEALLRHAPAALREIGAEALLIDQSILPGRTIAQAVDLPFVTVCCALPFNEEVGVPPAAFSWSYHDAWWARWRNRLAYRFAHWMLRDMKRLVHAYRRRYHLAGPMPLNPFSPLAQIAQLPAEFDFPGAELPACFHYTGPLIDSRTRPAVPFPFEKLTGQPLLYASLGTMQNRRPDLYRCIAAACAELDAQLVISLGGGDAGGAAAKLPGSPLVVPFAPQLELLDRATLTVTHAGMNTVLESLSCGVPLVAIPVTNDQPAVAARLKWCGAGDVVPLARLRVSRLRAAVQRVLADGAFRAQARRLQQAIARAGGVNRAADIVDSALRGGDAPRPLGNG